YSSERAETTYGTIGVKVWIFRGEILGGMKQVMNPAPADENRGKRRADGRNDRRNEGRDDRRPRNDGGRGRNDRAPAAKGE
ncbi:MAG TPA: 30S ribosomal protein S3, partial [Aquirhabdus sp.]